MVWYNMTNMFDNFKSFFRTKTFSMAQLIGFGDYNHAYDWTRQQSIGQYERSLYANKAINVRSQKVGQIQFQLFDKNGDTVENSPWLNLLNRPNAYQTGDQFWSLAQKYYDIVGAFYIVPMKKDVPFPELNTNTPPDSLRLLRADLVEVVLNQANDTIIGFKYNNNGDTTNYTIDQVIYHYRPDPRNPLLGESLLSAAVRSIETEVQISQYQANVLRNGGRLETILKVNGLTTPEMVDRTLAQYQEKYAGAKNAGRPLVVGEDMSLETQGLTPSELAYLDTKRATLDDICIATGVPKVLLGVAEDQTYANADAAQVVFLRDHIRPELENLTTTLDWRLIPMDLDLSFIDPTPENIDKKIQVANALHAMNALTINQKREMFDLDPDPSPEADRIYQPINLVPLESINQPPAEQKTKGFNHPLRNKDFRKLYGKQKSQRQDNHEKSFARVAQNYFDEQQKRIEKNLGGTKDLQSDIFNEPLELSIAKATFLPAIREIFIAEGIYTAETFGTTFNPNSNMSERLKERMDLFTNSIVSTTSEQLSLRIADNLTSGGSREDLVTSIEGLYEDISKGRAEVIARTEVHAAMSEGTVDAYRQANFPIKIWVTVGDDNVRPEHEAMDGEEQPLDQPFTNGEMAPSSPNCRCAV